MRPNGLEMTKFRLDEIKNNDITSSKFKYILSHFFNRQKKIVFSLQYQDCEHFTAFFIKKPKTRF